MNIIYFGGYIGESESTDRVYEYKHLQWNLLGKLAGPRDGHHSIKIGNMIYLFGGYWTK